MSLLAVTDGPVRYTGYSIVFPPSLSLPQQPPVFVIVVDHHLQLGLRHFLTALEIRMGSLDRSGHSIEGEPIGFGRELERECQTMLDPLHEIHRQ